MWTRGGIDPRGQDAGGGHAGAARCRAECKPVQDWAQLAPQPHWHCAPHRHSWPQAPAVCSAACSAACWQPQVQTVPGHMVQSQGTCWVAFMVGSFGLHRRRDVFDGRTFDGAAALAKAHETNGRRACGSGLADRPSGHSIAARRVAGARTPRRSPAFTVRARVRTLAGRISAAWRRVLSLPTRAALNAAQRTQVAFAQTRNVVTAGAPS